MYLGYRFWTYTLHFPENGVRFVPMDHTFFIGYRKTVVKPDEVFVSITIPYTTEVC